MPLLQNDRLREKEEREFKSRILAALEKPKKIRCLVIINSPIVIWLLSAIVITLGGGYYTTYRQCIADARQVSFIYTTYKYEISYIEDAIANAINETSTMAKFREALEKRIYFSYNLED